MTLRAHVLLQLNKGWTRERVAEATGASVPTVGRVKRRFLAEGLDAALYDRPRSGRRPKLSEFEKKKIIALACTEPPEGHSRWTIRLLAEHAPVEVDISREIVRLVLQEDGLKPWREKNVVRSRTGRRVPDPDEACS